MTDDLLVEKVREIGSSLGMSPLSLDKAVAKHKDDMRTYYRKLKKRWEIANKHLESEHSKRWFNQESLKSSARHTKEKDENYRRILADRQRLPLSVRLQSAFAKKELLESRLKSPSLDGNVGVNAEGAIGPVGYRADGPPEPPTIDVELHKIVITKHLESIERAIDAYQGLCPAGPLTEKQKDELLWSLAGVPSEVVARDFPELSWGQRSVEIHRGKLAEKKGVVVSPKTGLEKD